MSCSSRFDIDSPTNTYSKIRATSLDRISRLTESRSIVINFYNASHSSAKTDQHVQTDCNLLPKEKRRVKKKGVEGREIEVKPEEKLSVRTIDLERPLLINKREGSTATLIEKELVESGSESSFVVIKKTTSTPIQKKKTKKPMDYRHNEHKFGKNLRPTTDFERKKLEAELKAAEEIARIKETVIEKRLALELASLQNGGQPNQQKLTQPTPPPSQIDTRTVEELTLNKYSLMDTSTQDFDTLEYHAKVPPPRPAPPILPLPPPTHPLSLSAVPRPQRMSAIKLNSSSSILNPLKNPVSALDRKFNTERSVSDLKQQSFLNSSPSTANSPAEMLYPNENPYSVTDNAYEGLDRAARIRSTWRTAFCKIKKKIKLRPQEGWRTYQNVEELKGSVGKTIDKNRRKYRPLPPDS